MTYVCSLVYSNLLGDYDNSSEEWTPLLLLIPLRLGREKLNLDYGDALKSFLAMDNCVGIIGGRPRHSLYFVGFQEDSLIHMDPHLVKNRQDYTYTHHFHYNRK